MYYGRVTTILERSTPQEKYLGDLDVDKVDGYRSMHLISESLKFLINWIIIFDKVALVEHCNSKSWGQVEKPVKKVKFVMEDSKNPNTQPVVVEDI